MQSAELIGRGLASFLHILEGLLGLLDAFRVHACLLCRHDGVTERSVVNG